MSQEADFRALPAAELFSEIASSEIPWSRGLLCCEPKIFLPSFWEHWGAFFHACGVEVKNVSTAISLQPLTATARIYPFSFQNEAAVLACDQVTETALVEALLDAKPPAAGADAALEYLARRLVASVALSSPEMEQSSFISQSAPEEIDLAAVLTLNFSLGAKNCAIEIGLGPQACAKLDELWKTHLHAKVKESESALLRVQLAALAVPAAELIDCLRPDTVIDMASALSSKVTFILNDQIWGTGEVMLSASGLVVRYEGPDTEPEIEAGLSLLSLELCAFEIDAPLLAEFSQVGAMLETGVPESGEVALVTGGESVGRAELGRVGKDLAIRVLPN